MSATPHRYLEAVVGALLPSARREDVLGDLCERYTSPAGYALDALQIVPVMVTSHAWRQIHGLVVQRSAHARTRGQSVRGAVAVGNWLASSRPAIFFGGWYILLSVVSLLDWMRGSRRHSETNTD